MVQVCVFCHIYEIPVLKRKALDHLYNMIERRGLPAFDQFSYAFIHLPPGSPLRRFLVDVHCEKADDRHWPAYAQRTPSQDQEQLEFYEDVLQRFTLLHLDQQARGPLDLCDYHEHASDEERRACAAERAA